MAQIKPFQWYQDDNAPGFPGMKADVTGDVVDSFACEGGCNPGDLAVLGTDTEKQAKAAAAAGDKPIGIVLHTHKEPAAEGEAYYPETYALPIMTTGDVWVTAGGEVAAGDPVAFTLTKGFTKGTETTPSGNVFLTGGEEGDVVKIRIRNAAAISVAAAG